MKIQIVSDLHEEFHLNFNAFIKYIYKDNIDLLIIAGDLSISANLPIVFDKLFAVYNKIIYIIGNHEYYHSSFLDTHKIMKKVTLKYKNLHWLYNNYIVINSIKFIGTTLWFKDNYDNYNYKDMLNDFKYIKDFERFVYIENKTAKYYLNKEVERNSIVITHHLPTSKSIPKEFKNSVLNRFFVCDIENLIRDKQPCLWIHGHTHSSFDYFINNTRIIANPFGYLRYGENENFNHNLVLEI